MQVDDQDTLFEFPCSFTVKAMGLASSDFDTLVVEIVGRHVENLGEGSVRSRPSSGGKYLSVSVTFEAQSKRQLNAIYQDLTDHDRILMSL